MRTVFGSVSVGDAQSHSVAVSRGWSRSIPQSSVDAGVMAGMGGEKTKPFAIPIVRGNDRTGQWLELDPLGVTGDLFVAAPYKSCREISSCS